MKRIIIKGTVSVLMVVSVALLLNVIILSKGNKEMQQDVMNAQEVRSDTTRTLPDTLKVM